MCPLSALARRVMRFERSEYLDACHSSPFREGEPGVRGLHPVPFATDLDRLCAHRGAPIDAPTTDAQADELTGATCAPSAIAIARSPGSAASRVPRFSGNHRRSRGTQHPFAVALYISTTSASTTVPMGSTYGDAAVQRFEINARRVVGPRGSRSGDGGDSSSWLFPQTTAQGCRRGVRPDPQRCSRDRFIDHEFPRSQSASAWPTPTMVRLRRVARPPYRTSGRARRSGWPISSSRRRSSPLARTTAFKTCRLADPLTIRPLPPSAPRRQPRGGESA